MGQMLVFTNAVEGRDDEFNTWYDDVHLGEVLQVPAFCAARRFRTSAAQIFPNQSHQYLAVYEFTGDAQTAIDQLMAASATFKMSDAMAADSKIVLVDEHSAG
jgi:hypothetical protein